MLKSNTHIRSRLQALIAATMLICGPWILSASTSLACSAFSPVGSAILAGNYDWTVGNGVIFTNGRGLRKQAFLKSPLDNPRLRPATWLARYASLTLTQWGREFPMQGMNEAGLAGVVLNAPADYPRAGSTSYVISEMQWLQYQLDNFHSVVEVAAHAGDFGIQTISARLHYFLCDAYKDCALFEFASGRVQVRRQTSLPVRAITNSSYGDSYQTWLASGHGQAPLPEGYDSLHRFVRAGSYAVSGNSTLAWLLSDLRDLGTTGWTNWHSVFATSTGVVVVTPWQSNASYSIERSEFAVTCRQPQKMRRIQNGLISNWSVYERSYDAEVFARAAAPIGGFSSSLQQRMVDYQSGFRCQ